MLKVINLNYFLYLYKNKKLAPNTIKKSINLIFTKIDPKDNYTKFIFYMFFKDITSLSCPDNLKYILDNEKITNFIKENFLENFFFEHDLKLFPNFCFSKIKLKLSQMVLLDILKFYLTIEINIENLYYVDIPYFNTLISNLNDCSKNKLLKKFKISPLVIVILQSMNDPLFHKEFHKFLYVMSNNYTESFKTNLNYKIIDNEILCSNFKIINEYHVHFINLYPELIYGSKVHKNRLFFFSDPLNLPLNFKILRIYIPSILYYLKVKNNKLDDPNFDLLYKLIYVEKILFDKKLYNLLHLFILDNYNLLYVLLKRKFSMKIIPNLVKYIPSFHLAFNYSVKLLQETNDEFYSKIIYFLAKKYKTVEYFKIIAENRELFNGKILKKFQIYFDELKI